MGLLDPTPPPYDPLDWVKQPLGPATLDFRIVDARSGVLEKGELAIAELRSRQPWAAPV